MEGVKIATFPIPISEKTGLWKIIKGHFRRSFLEVINFFLNHDGFFRLVGWVNKRIKLIESVFIVYPADEKYALAYVYPKRLPRVKWSPWPGGILWQNGKVIIMFVVSASTNDFLNLQNVRNMRKLVERTKELCRLFSAPRKTFAGILPGVLYMKRIIREAPEAELTAKAVAQVIEEIKAKENLGTDFNIVVLGGEGFIGRKVVDLLPKETTYSVDLVEGRAEGEWPVLPTSKKTVVLNIAHGNAMLDYLGSMDPGTIVVNEAYPEPSPDALKKMEVKGILCYHVVGIDATAFPRFPKAYAGAIPCCAAWPSDKMKVVVKRMTA